MTPLIVTTVTLKFPRLSLDIDEWQRELGTQTVYSFVYIVGITTLLCLYSVWERVQEQVYVLLAHQGNFYEGGLVFLPPFLQLYNVHV